MPDFVLTGLTPMAVLLGIIVYGVRVWVKGLLVPRAQVESEKALLREQVKAAEMAAEKEQALLQRQIDLSDKANAIQIKLMTDRLGDKDAVIRSSQAETLAARVDGELQREQNRELLSQQDALLSSIEAIEAYMKVLTTAKSGPT